MLNQELETQTIFSLAHSLTMPLFISRTTSVVSTLVPFSDAEALLFQSDESEIKKVVPQVPNIACLVLTVPMTKMLL